MKYTGLSIIVLLCCGLSVISCNHSQKGNNYSSNIGNNSMDSAQNLNETKFSDQATLQQNGKYLMKIYSDGLYNIQASKEAMDRSQDKTVENMAQHLIKNATLLNDTTQKLADKKQISIPGSLTPEQKEKLKLLQSEKAKDFNDDYLRQMVINHKNSIDLLHEAQKSNDTDIVHWSKALLPKFEKNLDEVTSVQAKADSVKQ